MWQTYSWLPLVGILIVAGIFRFLWLDRVPNGVVQDEVTYLLEAKSIAQSGTDITHTWQPLSVFWGKYPPEAFLPQAELPYFLLIPAVGWLPYSLVDMHITGALFGMLLVLAAYWLTKELLDRETALIAALLVAVNPWFIAISRTAYEVPLAVCFYLLAMVVLLKAKKWAILWALPLFLLGFYSYIATKVIFALLVCLTSFVAWRKNKKQYLLPYLAISGFSVLFTFAYFIMLTFAAHGGRLNELFLPSNPVVNSLVSNGRIFVISSPFTALFANKLFVFLDILLQKFMLIFSFDYLFLYADSFASFTHHGLFYIIDAPLLLIGLCALFLKRKKVFFFITLYIGLGILPQLIHSPDAVNFTPHITFMIPFLLIVIAYGIVTIGHAYENKKTYPWVFGVLAVVYTGFVLQYFYFYFYQMPIQNSYFSLPDRILARYITLAKEEHAQVTVYDPEATSLMMTYLLYANEHITPSHMQISLQTKHGMFDNLLFRPCTGGSPLTEGAISIVNSAQCGLPVGVIRDSIPRLSDNGEVFAIYNDSVCTPYALKAYTSNLSRNDFLIEKLTPQQFCETFILRQH